MPPPARAAPALWRRGLRPRSARTGSRCTPRPRRRRRRPSPPGSPAGRTPGRGAAGQGSRWRRRPRPRPTESAASPAKPARRRPWPYRRSTRRARPRDARGSPCAPGSTGPTCRGSSRTRRWSARASACSSPCPRAPRSVASPDGASFRELRADVLIEMTRDHLGGDSHRVHDGSRGGGPVADDGHTLHAQQRRAAILGVVEELEQLLDLGTAQHVGECLLQHSGEHAAGGLIELEDRIADETVAHHDVDLAALAPARQDVAPFHAPDVADPGSLLQELVRFLDDGIPLLVLFPDVEEPDTGARPPHHVPGVHRAQVREAHELARVAVHVRPAVDRSEEHTSELQSLAYLVCRLLLEKKKKKTTRVALCGIASHPSRSQSTAAG